MADFALKTAALTKGTLAFADRGTGETVVFLHGIGSSASSWSRVFDLLPETLRGIAWNAPGYPPSSALATEWPNASDYSEQLKALLDHCQISTCHIVGHSLGCLVAARFATLYPGSVLSLTLASCALGHAKLPPEERERLLTSRIDDIEKLGARGMAEKRGPRLLGPHASNALIESVIANMASVDPQGYRQAARMLSTGDLLADIEQLSPAVPVQFIYGSADVITPPEANQRAASARPSAPVKVLEGAGHACYIEQPDRFLRALEGLIARHD